MSRVCAFVGLLSWVLAAYPVGDLRKLFWEPAVFLLNKVFGKDASVFL